jgi:hypothetical protein
MPRLPGFSIGSRRRSTSPVGMRYAGTSAHRQEPRRSTPWALIATLAGGAMVAALVFAGVVAFSRSNLLRVNHVQVVGARIVDASAIEAAAHINHESLLRLDAAGAAQRVAALPGIAQAHVHPDWPNGAVIDVSERQGWGYWQVMGTRVVIDAEGRVVEKARPPAQNAPTIYQIGAGSPPAPNSVVDADTVTLVTRLLSDGTFTRLGLQPQRFDFEQARGLVVRVNGGPAAVFGDSHDYEFKVAAWVAMNSRVKTDGMSAFEIDLRFGKELVVR